MTRRYKIKRITLQNITTHENTQLALPGSGSLALVGPNGAGKSSIVEAVYAALTLKTLRGRDYDLVTRGRRSGVIKLLMEADGDLLEAIVRYEVGDRRKSKSVALKRNGRLVASTIQDYTAKMAEILGIKNIRSRDYEDLVKSTTIIPQGGLRSIAEKMSSPGEFKKLIEAAIGLPDYRKALEQLNRMTITYRDPLYTYPVPRISTKDLKRMAQSQRYRGLNRILEELREKMAGERERLEKNRIMAEALEKELATVKNQLDTIQEEIRERERRTVQLEARARELRRKKEELEELRREYRDLAGRLEEAVQARKRLEELKTIIRLQESINRYYRLLAEKARLEARLGEVKAILEDARTVEEALESAREYERLNEKLRELIDKQLELSKRKSSIEERKRQIEDLASRTRALIRQASKKLGVEAPGDIEAGLEAVKKAYEGLESRIEEARKRLEDILREEAIARSKIEEARRALEAVLKATEPRCPVCGRPLNKEHKSKVISELRDRLGKEEARLEELRGLSHRLSIEIERLEGLAGSVERVIRLAEGLARELDAEIHAKLVEELEEINKELAEIHREIEESRRRLKELEEPWRRYHSALERLSKRGVDPSNVKALELEHAELEERLGRTEEELEELKREILAVTGSASMADAKRRVDRAAEEFSRLSSLAGQVEVLREGMERLQGKIRELESEVEGIRELEKELEGIERELEELQRRREELEERRDDVVNEIARANREIEDASREIERLKGEVESWSEVKKRVITAMVAGAILMDVQERLLENARLSIEGSMSEILEKFGLEYHAVDIRDTEKGFEVSALSRRGSQPMPVSALSGGEQSALALAYVMALQRTLALRVGFLVLDEPTSELDMERRETLMELIGRVSSEGVAEQLIVVTHNEDVIDKVDQVCRVSRPRGVSKVDCED
ncbi:MAG: SMC family ATPase [Desulfurococcales archaeon]|nr:SMC family ATPase [Desulfurococcales archaeon]